MNSLSFSPRNGFTLVELSIVLVIIGLLIGGVLVGRDLIHAAEIRSQIKQIENYQAAINTFSMRFDGLPGDIPNARELFLVSEWPDITGGNGNSRINDAGSSTYADLSGEVLQFWMQLGAAKMIEGSYSNAPRVGEGFPATALGRNGVIAIYDATWLKNNIFYIGVQSAANPGVDNAIHGVDSLTPEEAWKIDSKLDDGHPYLGNVQARAETGGTYNVKPDYFDTLLRLDMPLYADLLRNFLISEARADASVDRSEACVLMDDDAATPDAAEGAASYAITSDQVNCQLAVRFF